MESLVETANVLLEAGVARPTSVRDRAEELNADMTRIMKIVATRMNLAESLGTFVDDTNAVSSNSVFESNFEYAVNPKYGMPSQAK